MKYLFSSLALAFLLLACAGCDSSSVSDVSGRLTGEGVFFGNKVDVHGNRVIVGTRNNSAYIFERTAGGWMQQAELDDGGKDFGMAVALNDSYAFVGAPGDLESNGVLHIFGRSDEKWEKQSSFYAERELGSLLGGEIAVEEERLVVSALNTEIAGKRNAGTAYVLELNGEQWTQTAKLTAKRPRLDARLGMSVDLSGNKIVLGAWGEDTGQKKDVGAAYVFRQDSGTWEQAARLTASDAAPRARFGQSVAIDEGIALVSSSADSVGGKDFVGTIYAYEHTGGGAWAEQQKLNPRDAERRDFFGKVVDLSPSGNYLISSSIYKDKGYGAAYIFHRQPGGQWQQQAKLTAPTRQKSAFFGEDVAITDRYAVVGAPGENGEQGAAYIFERNGTHWALAQ